MSVWEVKHTVTFYWIIEADNKQDAIDIADEYGDGTPSTISYQDIIAVKAKNLDIDNLGILNKGGIRTRLKSRMLLPQS